jgi:hypothetical protein
MRLKMIPDGRSRTLGFRGSMMVLIGFCTMGSAAGAQSELVFGFFFLLGAAVGIVGLAFIAKSRESLK